MTKELLQKIAVTLVIYGIFDSDLFTEQLIYELVASSSLIFRAKTRRHAASWS